MTNERWLFASLVFAQLRASESLVCVTGILLIVFQLAERESLFIYRFFMFVCSDSFHAQGV